MRDISKNKSGLTAFEAMVDGLPNPFSTQVSSFESLVDSLPNPFLTEITENRLQSSSVFLGFVALVAVGTVALASIEAFTKGIRAQFTEARANDNSDNMGSRGLPQNVAVDTFPAPTVLQTTTTTEAPIIFETQVGERIGTLKIPAICIDIEILQFSEDDRIQNKIGTGNALLDKKVENSHHPEVCEQVEQYDASTGGNFVSRFERDNRASAVTPNNPGGRVSLLQPVAGHERGPNGYSSVLPGQPGNSVIAGHGSTFSAPFADIPALTTGDVAFFERADGRHYIYKLIETTIIDDSDDTAAYDYRHPVYNSTLTTFMCSDESGRTGSPEKRYIARWGLIATGKR